MYRFNDDQFREAEKVYTEVLGLKELFNHEQAIGLGNQDQLYIVLRQETNVNSHHQQENKGPIILTFQVAFEDKNSILTRVTQGGYVVRNSLQIKEHNIDYVFI